jgi:hypothetical protein
MTAVLRQLLLLGALCLGAAAPVSAATIFLAGDSNLGNAIDGSSGASVNVGNSTWFTNILAGGTSVLIQDEFYSASIQTSSDAINAHYNGLGGVTSTLDTSGAAITSAALAGVDLLLSVVPSNSYTASEISVLSSFLAGSGSVLFMGDNSPIFTIENGWINAALAALGSSMSLGNQSIDSGVFFTTTNIDADSFNAGVASFTYVATTDVSGGTSLIRTVTGAQTFVAYEIVPEPSTALLLGVGLVTLTVGRKRRAA